MDQFIKWEKLTSEMEPQIYQQKAQTIKPIHLKDELHKITTAKMTPVSQLQFDLLNTHVPNEVAVFVNKTFNLIDRNRIMTQDNFKLDDYLQLSMIPLLLKQIQVMLGSYLQLQIKIDPETNQFYKFGNEGYNTIVNTAIKKKNVIELWQYCCLKWMDKKQVSEWVYQILNFVESQFRKFNYLVDPEIFYAALINEQLRYPFEQYEIQNVQNETIKTIKEKAEKRKMKNSFQYQIANFKNAIMQKRDSYTKENYFFFEQVKVNNFEKMILSRLTESLEE